MTFSGIIGLEKPLSVIGRMLTSGRIPHALLFHGPEGVGKRTVAERLAISLLCERPGADGAACGSCAACVKAAHGNHPDLLVTTRLPKAEPKGGTEPDDETEGEGSGDLKAWIVVDQVRELAQHAAYAPREGRRRVFLVDPADRMNAAAQNALLKTLEEPPGRALIILISARPHVLFPTVRSRCSQLGFAAMEPDRLAAALAAHGLAAGEARSRAALAEGRPGRALALDPEATARRRDAILELLDGLVASPAALAGMPDYVDEILGDGEPATSEGLELATSLLRDAARTAAGLRSILNADVAPRVARLGRALGADRAGELAELADRLRGDLRLNVNRTLLAESFLAAVAGGPSPE